MSRTQSLDTTDSWTTFQLSALDSLCFHWSRGTGVRIHLLVTSTRRNTQEAELLLSLEQPLKYCLRGLELRLGSHGIPW